MNTATHKTHTVLHSGDDKTGDIAATYRTHETCPPSCPFLPRKNGGNGGCFGTGRIGAIAARYGIADTDYSAVRALADTMAHGRTFRPNIVGDFNRADGTTDTEYIAACNAVADARPDVRVFAYTHEWRRIPRASFRFTVRASCETVDDVRAAHALGYSAVIVDDGTLDYTAAAETVGGGARFVTCAHTTHGTQCAQCGLCPRDSRAVVVFPVHSASAKLAAAAVARRRAE